MKEITQADIAKKQTEKDSFALFVYTPLCGTCKLAERMLKVIEQMSDILPLYQTNINFAPSLVTAWQISSVPCLIVINQGQIMHQVYALRSIETVYELLKGIK